MSHFGIPRIPRLNLKHSIQIQTSSKQENDQKKVDDDLEEKTRILEFRFRQEQFMCFTFQTELEFNETRTIKHFVESLATYIKIGSVVWVIKDNTEAEEGFDSVIRKHRYIVELREPCHISLIKTIVSMFMCGTYLEYVYDFKYADTLPEGSQEMVAWINNRWVFK